MHVREYLVQLHDAVAVACWLFEKCNAPHLARFEDVENEPPIIIARQLLASAQQLVNRQDGLSRVNVSALARGHGAAVCIFLRELAIVAMQSHSPEPIQRIDEVTLENLFFCSLPNPAANHH